MGLRVQVVACSGFKVWGLGSRVWLPLILLPLYISISVAAVLRIREVVRAAANTSVVCACVHGCNQ